MQNVAATALRVGISDHVTFLGVEAYFQWAVVEVGGTLALSDGLRIQIGD